MQQIQMADQQPNSKNTKNQQASYKFDQNAGLGTGANDPFEKNYSYSALLCCCKAQVSAQELLKKIFCTQLIIDLILLLASCAPIPFLLNETDALVGVIPSVVYFLIAFLVDLKCLLDITSDSIERRSSGWYCCGMGLASLTDVLLTIGFIVYCGVVIIWYVVINLLADGSDELFNRIALASIFIVIFGLGVVLLLTCINQLVLICGSGQKARDEVQNSYNKSYQ